MPHVLAITLCPFGIYLRDVECGDKYTILHESIHWKQQTEMLIIFFYLWYLIEWTVKGFKYYNISFEREAFRNDTWLYLSSRKHFAWFKYIRK
jgi:hypothetical protein